MEPPIIPFMPLLLKDITFAHEGNKTYLEKGLVNFEKMVSAIFFLLFLHQSLLVCIDSSSKDVVKTANSQEPNCNKLFVRNNAYIQVQSIREVKSQVCITSSSWKLEIP